MTKLLKKFYPSIPPDTEQVGKTILNAAFKVHTALGPGLLESVYEACNAYEATHPRLKCGNAGGCSRKISNCINRYWLEIRSVGRETCDCRIQIRGNYAPSL
jgi:hypothetical protein